METVVHIASAALTEAPFGDTQQSLDGDPTIGELSLARYADDRVEVGIWEITPGRMRDIEVDEASVIVSGRATIVFDDGRNAEIGPGDLLFLRAGDRTVWTIHETLRKVFVVAL
jgi:hypothetical protein